MKPCTYEQDLLFAIHGEATAWQKIRVFLHCLQCPSCRNRKREFVATSHLLMGLRSVPALIPTTHAVPIRKRRLILCSAAVAVTAAAVSYYVAFGWPDFGDSQASGSTGLSRQCAPDEEPQVVSITREPVKSVPDRGRSKKQAK